MTLGDVTNGSEPGMFLCPVLDNDFVDFEKRDIILVLGLLLFMIGLVPFMPLIYAMLIVAAMGIGIKFYVTYRRKTVERDVGRGICADCGSPIHGRSCTNCNPPDTE